MTNLEIGVCVFVVLALLLMIWRAWVWANEAHERLNEARGEWLADQVALESDLSRSIHDAHTHALDAGSDLRLLCDHLGVTIVQEPSRTVVRVKGSPEKGE